MKTNFAKIGLPSIFISWRNEVIQVISIAKGQIEGHGFRLQDDVTSPSMKKSFSKRFVNN